MTLKATCHCGATSFEVSEAPTSVTECTMGLTKKKHYNSYTLAYKVHAVKMTQKMQ